MHTHKRVLNPQVFLEFICFVTFAGLMFYLVYTGRYQAYVTPRMVPYFYFTIAVMAIWALTGCFRLFQPQYKTRAAHCLVLAIPLILLLLPHSAINTAELSTGYLSANTFTGQPGKSSTGKIQMNASVGADLNISYSSPAVDTSADDNEVAEINITTPSESVSNPEPIPSVDASKPDNTADAASDTSSAETSAQPTTQQDSSISSLSGLDVANKKITVPDDNVSAWLYELYENMDKYVGYKISIKGFVYRDPAVMKANEFVPARLMMSCCVADLSPCGLLCQYDNVSELKDDAWVMVEGTLHKAKMTFNGQTYDDIQINVNKITPAEKVDGYLYPQ